MQDLVDELLDRARQLAHLVALALELLERLVDRAEDVEVRGGAHVALVRGEGEDRDGDPVRVRARARARARTRVRVRVGLG